MPDEKQNQIHPCKWCQQEIAFLITKKGKKMPVDAESLTFDDAGALGAGDQVEFRYGEHVSHFGTCPEYKKQHDAGKARKEPDAGTPEEL